MTDLSGSKCLVTGATNPTSIGFVAALYLLQAGACHVTIMGRNESKLEEACTILSRKIAANNDGTKKKVSGILGDLKKPETMAAVVEESYNKMEGIDVLVCSGGNGYSEYLGLDVKNPDSYRMMQNVAVLSPMFLAEAAFPYLSKSKNKHGGTVVNIGSVSADVCWPDTAPHNFSMAMKNNMTKTLAFKYRNDNIRVNGVNTGVIHTGALDVMAEKKGKSVEDYAALRSSSQPLNRNGTPEQVSNAILYLASPASGFTTGEFIRVDGGLHLSNWWNRQIMLNEYNNSSTGK